jgi:hypothetical protein
MSLLCPTTTATEEEAFVVLPNVIREACGPIFTPLYSDELRIPNLFVERDPMVMFDSMALDSA